MKKLLAFSAIVLCTMATATGCGERGGEKVDSTKAQLRVATFDGGVGDQWLKNAAKIFEEKCAERDDFQDGRVGVQIHITADRSCTGDVLETSDLNKDVYFTESVDYYALTNLHKLADITDILTAPNADDGGKTILSKIDGNLLNYMNRDGKYYAVPFYDCFYGLVYDKDLFSEKSFYMTNEGTFTKNPADFGTGPNGVAGDWDDGLPKTYDQFYRMMTVMVQKQVVPFTYSAGNATWYTARALNSFWSDDEGYEDVNLNYTFSGTAHHLVKSINADGVAELEEATNITRENGYLLRKQAGLYNALSFARTITKDSKNYQPYSSNYDVQDAFINSKYMGGSTKPIAMMFEGTWWENEAAPSFDNARNMGAESFNYGFMPIPKSSEDKIGDATLMNLNESYGFINANCENMKLAKEFFAFLHSDALLREFTKETNMTRGLTYTFDTADFDKISTYAQDLINIRQSGHAKVVYPCSGLDFFVDNSATFSNKTWPWGTKNYTDSPIIKFIDDKNLTAEAYFNDHASLIGEAEWLRMVNR